MRRWDRRLSGVAGASCFLVTLAPTRTLAANFCWGSWKLGENPVQVPDLVQQFQFGGCIAAQVTDEFTDPGPVLLLDVGAFWLLGRERVNVMRCSRQKSKRL